MHKVDPEVGPDFLPTLIPLHWSSYSVLFLWERDPLVIGLLVGGGVGGGGHIRIPPSHAVIGMAVGLEGPCGQLRSVFRALRPLLHALPIFGSLPHHLTGVGVYQHSSRGVSGLIHYSYHLPGVLLQSKKVKEVRKDVKILLKQACLHQRDQAVFSVEVCRQELY